MTARPKINFYLRSDNLNCMLGKLECSLFTRHLYFKVINQKKTMDLRAYNPVEENYMRPVATIFILSAKQDQFNQESALMNAPVR